VPSELYSCRVIFRMESGAPAHPSTMLILAMPGTGFVGMMTEMAEPA
jgi:hypothetical protein